MYAFPLYNINNKIISNQSTRIKTTQGNRGNKTSHTHTPTKYTTRTASPGKKEHTHMHPSNTQHKGSDYSENKFHITTLPNCLNSP
jgi:hypothetical protein